MEDQNINGVQVPVAPVPSTEPSFAPLPEVSVLFKDSWTLLKQRFSVMFLSFVYPALAVLASAIIAALVTALIYYFVNHVAAVVFGILCGITVFLAYIYAILWGTVAQLTAMRDAGEMTGYKENLKRSRPIIWSLFLVNLIKQLAVLGGTLLFIVPGIILSIRYAFAQMILVVEGKKGRSALAQSKAYVMGRTWQVFWRWVLFGLIYAVPYIVVQIVMAVVNNKTGDAVGGIIIAVLNVVIFYYGLTFGFTLYNHLRNTASQVSGEKYMGGVTGWTVWGCTGGALSFIVFVVAIVILAISTARMKDRDVKRIADMQGMSSVLEVYYAKHDMYPQNLKDLTPGYVATLPVAPTPNDGKCTKMQNEYNYVLDQDGKDYKLTFCLGQDTEKFKAGMHTMSYEGVK